MFLSRINFVVVLVALLSLGSLSLYAADNKRVSSHGKNGNFVVVIDPGHGGHDPGTVDTKACEKDINLAVALELGKYICKDHPDVKVVYTRDTDRYRGLQERCNIANNAHGDLFISIHVNSIDRKSKGRTTIQGTATYTLGLHRSAENLAVAKRENAVMMLEDDFSTRYYGFDPNSTESYIIFELNQNKHIEQSIDFASRIQREMHAKAGRVDKGVRQAGFWVLAQTGMPAVLVELDYICNPNSRRFLVSDTGQKKMAAAIAAAFTSYKRAYDNTMGKSVSGSGAGNGKDVGIAASDSSNAGYIEPSVGSEDNASSDDGRICYRIQFLTHPDKIKSGNKLLRGITDYDCYIENGTYKYVTGSYPTKAEAQKALPKVKKKFSDAFVVKMRGMQRVR